MAIVHAKAKRFNGKAADYVLIFEWQSGKFLAKKVPDAAGNWSFEFDKNMRVGVVYVADGCQPISHGAYDLVLSKL